VVEHVDVDAVDAADEADVLPARRALARDPEEVAVVAGQPDRGLPVAPRRCTMSLLTLPTRTILATSTVCASETRSPPTNLTGSPRRSM
jgi:hypothetical protein